MEKIIVITWINKSISYFPADQGTYTSLRSSFYAPNQRQRQRHTKRGREKEKSAECKKKSAYQMNIVASVKLTPTEIKNQRIKSVYWICINNSYRARLANEYFNGMVLLKWHLSTKQHTHWKTAWLLFSENCLIHNYEDDDGVKRRMEKTMTPAVNKWTHLPT